MTASHRKFGDLLEEGIKRVHINRKKPIGYILDEFGYELRPDDTSKGRHALGHWYYKKRIPASMEDVAKLAELIVTNSDVERDWLKSFLESAGFPKTEEFCTRFFLPGSENPDDAIPFPQDQVSTFQDPPIHVNGSSIEKKNHILRTWYLVGGIVLISVVFSALWIQRMKEQTYVEITPASTKLVQQPPPTATETIVITATLPIEEPTSIPISPTPDFASFDGKCPSVSPSSFFEYSDPQSFLDFLNNQGSFVALQSGFNSLVQNKDDLLDGRVLNVDLTGDGAAEVIISAILRNGSLWQILGCDAGKYKVLVNVIDSDHHYLRFAVDLTGDGLPEIIGYRQTRSEATDLYEFFVQGWNGHQIVDLIDDSRFLALEKRISSDITDWQRTVANATVTTRDTNGDGLFEVVVTGGLITPVPTCETLFERQFTETWAWNGRSFQLVERLYMAPIYRFQRSADGDLAFALKQLDTALEAYQDVLFDSDLFQRDQYLSHLEYCKGIDSANNAPIQNERAQLEAYARWRILLINSLLESDDAMQVVYKTLQEKFPDGKPGYSYAAIASVFWEEYQKSGDIFSACDAANIAASNYELFPGHIAENMCFIP